MSYPHPVQTSPIADALPPVSCEVAGAGVDWHVASVAAPRVVTRAGVAPGHAGAGPSLPGKMWQDVCKVPTKLHSAQRRPSSALTLKNLF